MKFVADVMLGRLAKRLRLLGFDVYYNDKLNDNGVIGISLDEDRVILTRDRSLSNRPLSGTHLFIRSERVQEQVDQVLAALPLTAHPLTRCSECNRPLIPIARRDAKDLVPAHVYERYKEFHRCDACGRIYWKGSHVERMRSANAVKGEMSQTGKPAAATQSMHQK
jgi:uncharacterized protein